MSDLETGKRGFMLTNDRTFLEPYEQARRDLHEGVLTEAQAVAENGLEDERVDTFRRLVNEWIQKISEPQIRARGSTGSSWIPRSPTRARPSTDDMRGILTDLRKRALDDADTREDEAFALASASKRPGVPRCCAMAIVLALGSRAWIARDIAVTTRQIEEALAATGRLEGLPPLPARRDELRAVFGEP